MQVVSEVYALHPVKVEPHVVLSLVLYKMVDPSPEVREDALHMLHVLSTREWHLTGLAGAAAAATAAGLKAQEQQQEENFTLEAEGGSGTVVVMGTLQDSYQQFQFELSIKVARCVVLCRRSLHCALLHLLTQAPLHLSFKGAFLLHSLPSEKDAEACRP